MLFPSPSQQIVNVDLSMSRGAEVELNLFDLMGKRVKSVKLGTVQHHREGVNVADLPNGTYLMQIRAGEQVSRKKFQVMH